MSKTNNQSGVCFIKEEYIDNIANTSLSCDLKHKMNEEAIEEPDNKIKKSTQEHKLKDKKRGQNKCRPAYRDAKRDTKPCPSIMNLTSGQKAEQCQYDKCQFIHDPAEYLKNKPADLGDECHVFNVRGKCSRGITCRFGAGHLTSEGLNTVNEGKANKWAEDTINTLQPILQAKLQKKTYDFDLSEKLVKHLDKRNVQNTDLNKDEPNSCNIPVKHSGTITDEDIIKRLPKEKKNIDWKNKLYLSPLTTLGNLPFRRICKEYGADITCGEMALCESILKGMRQEWALVKRHVSEDIFGVQICGNNPYVITKVSQVLEENCNVDFVDLNLGCPLDFIYKKGGGSGMMQRTSVLESSIKCASNILSVPFTVKIRTGISEYKKIAHTIMPKIAIWGASLITLHGRSREARYIRSADWQYIEQCAKSCEPCPVFGNGDILSYEEYLEKRKIAPTIHGVMIGRGALIKPWIFTEIKEQKLWDISSKERFDIIKKYTNYGLEHWGSDTQGVESTRRFLLEWLSFLYRYVPVGLLQRPPQKINERPPTYHGRDDLETLMASANCKDWIKISEMLLGPVPDGFKFLPKHKANSY